MENDAWSQYKCGQCVHISSDEELDAFLKGEIYMDTEIRKVARIIYNAMVPKAVTEFDMISAGLQLRYMDVAQEIIQTLNKEEEGKDEYLADKIAEEKLATEHLTIDKMIKVNEEAMKAGIYNTTPSITDEGRNRVIDYVIKTIKEMETGDKVLDKFMDGIHPSIIGDRLDAIKRSIHDSCGCSDDDHEYEDDCTCCECNNLLERVEDLEEDGNTHEDVFDEVYHKLHHMEELVAWQDEMIKKLITKIGTLETRMNMPMNDGVIKALADRVYELEKLNPTRNPLEKTKLEWSNTTDAFCDF